MALFASAMLSSCQTILMKLPTDNDDWNDFFGWDFENYQEIDYLEIVLDLTEDCFNDNDCNLQQVSKNDVCFPYDGSENNLITCDEKVDLEVIKDGFNRIIEDTTSNVHVNQSMDHAPKKEKF
ncbi:uncharacterized protein LOC111624213 [Centruroides sculpturatus]|uniref:uncharacterized protein LOC111624213 n=1 Tax=Centruroides sculpturatus TaxID=218467 RepID=UPI000C6EDE8F|nr:uncharacterized protein LOC111624213 [Centruroides sculpturatus]